MTYVLKVMLNIALLVGLFAAGLSFLVPSAKAVVGAILVVLALTLILYMLSAQIMVFRLKARVIPDDGRFHTFHEAVAADATQLGLKTKPDLLMIDSPVFNAYALGHGANGAIVFTSGLLNGLGREELRAVTVHELAHIKHGDNALSVLNMVTVFAIRVVSWILFGMIVLVGFAVDIALGSMGGKAAGKSTRLGAVLGAWVRQISEWLIGFAVVALMGVSRENEFRADAAGAKIVSRTAMAGALIMMERINGAIPVTGWMDRLYRSHPETDQRLTALRKGVA